MERKAPDFLGRGWGFPPRFDLGTGLSGQPVGQVAMVANDTDIQQSLRVLMSTARGERIMRPGYGVGLFAQVFDPTDETSLGEFRSQIEDAVLFFEPRIKVESVEIDTARAPDGVLMITLSYYVPLVNSRSNMVFPFYLQEGTNVSDHSGTGPLLT
ncbi:GPW/gp25 family protein [Thalassococcus sp. BH17M4-6]|uniref:GPW/gp25 family protein n=1 Tax=Thalassococcus sp. BH17M4-6 TaxID=3413148 RepID=UPI003BC7F9EB